MSPEQTPAGWYPGPEHEGLRYWSGSEWTEHRTTSGASTVKVARDHALSMGNVFLVLAILVVAAFIVFGVASMVEVASHPSYVGR